MIIFCIPLLQNILNIKCTCINGTQYMCIEYNECHYGGMYNVYVKEFLLLKKLCI